MEQGRAVGKLTVRRMVNGFSPRDGYAAMIDLSEHCDKRRHGPSRWSMRTISFCTITADPWQAGPFGIVRQGSSVVAS